MRTTRLRVPVTAGALLALAGALAGCGPAAVQDVTVYRAGPRSVADHPGGVGVTTAGITVRVSVDFRDLVTDVGVRPGDQVRRGQPLLSLDPAPFQVQATQLNAKLHSMGLHEGVTIAMATGAARVSGAVTCSQGPGATTPVKVLVGGNGTEVIKPGQSGDNTAVGSFHLDSCVTRGDGAAGNTGTG